MGKRILLADDSVTIQKVVELTFMDEDFEVVAVSNGDDAVARLAEVEPDLVIADVHMPGASGYEVCRRVKQWRPRTPVLLLVGTFEPFQEEEARRVDADSYLKKPFDSQELLQRALELTAAAAEPAPPAFTTAPADEVDLWQAPEAEPEAQAGELYAAGVGGDEPAGPLGQEVPDDLVLEASPWTEAEEEEGAAGNWAAAEPSASASAAEPSPETAADQRTPSFATTLAAASPAATVYAATSTAADAPAAAAAAAAPASPETGSNGGLSDADVERIARRVVELLGEQLVREVAWEVVPDMAELVIKDRLRELERQIEGP